MNDHLKEDRTMIYVAVFFVIGMLWVFMHPANDAAGTPTEHKCYYETGYESC